MVKDHAAGDNAACIAAEIFEQGKFLLGELQLDAAAMGFAPDEIKFKVGDAQAGGLGLIGSASPKERTQPGYYLSDSEGLSEVVVASPLEA